MEKVLYYKGYYFKLKKENENIYRNDYEDLKLSIYNSNNELLKTYKVEYLFGFSYKINGEKEMNNDIKKLNGCYKEVQQLRKNIDMKKYNSNKELNKNDRLYSWMFDNDAVLKETKKELLEQFNNINYIHNIFYSYKEVLYNCQKDI